MTKHTAGAWVSDKNGDMVSTASGHDICTVFGQVQNGEGEANARLISAAPELLKSLIESLAAMERMDTLLLELTDSPKECEKGEIIRARAVIEKATKGFKP